MTTATNPRLSYLLLARKAVMAGEPTEVLEILQAQADAAGLRVDLMRECVPGLFAQDLDAPPAW